MFRPALLALLLSACAAHDTKQDENVMLVRSLFQSFNHHDWKTMAELYADSAKFLDPSFGKDFIRQSRQQIIAKYAELQKIFPDIRDDVLGIYPSGDRVIVEFISTGRSDQGFRLRLPIISVLRFDKGQIISDATYYDLENP